jgi:protein-L-isoaspartate(D-aspartate) O-methyltransferase
VSSVCPKCGFDLEPGTACPMCGYADGHEAKADGHAGGTPGAARKSNRATLGVLGAAVFGLMAVLVFFILSDLNMQAKGTVAAASTAVAPVPAVTPAAAPAEAIAAPPSSPTLINENEKAFDISSRKDAPPTTSKTAFIAWMTAHTDQTARFLSLKWDLAQKMLRVKTITHTRTLEAFLRAPRELFARDTKRAYDDAALPIGYGQTISGPQMVGRMTDYLDVQPEQKVLEIGTGSGYQSAVLSELSNHVYTIEIVAKLAQQTDAIYRKHEAVYPEYKNIQRKIDDGYYGWLEHAPFDRIIVTCGIDHVPPELIQELAPEGIMVIPVGPPSGQTILRIIKHISADGAVSLDREDIFQGKKKQIFVPFTSRDGLHTLDSGKP